MKTEKFTFTSLPTTVAELQAMPEISLDSPFKTAALTLAVLCNYEKNPTETCAMLDVLRGPAPMSNYDKQFLRDRMVGKNYKAYSFFEGATPANNYTPNTPYVVEISDNPYSYPEENWAVLHVQSSGADSARQLKFRKKPSTGQWFLNDILCLADIRIPVEADPWA